MPLCDFPLPSGTATEHHYDFIQFQNHQVWYEVAAPGTKSGNLTPNQVTWCAEGLAMFYAAQLYLASLQQDSGGGYCLYSQPAGAGTIFWPVVKPVGGCGAVPTVAIPVGKMAEITVAFDYLDCVMMFLRDNTE